MNKTSVIGAILTIGLFDSWFRPYYFIDSLARWLVYYLISDGHRFYQWAYSIIW